MPSGKHLTVDMQRRIDRLLLTTDVPICRLAERFGISDASIAIRYRRLGLKTVKILPSYGVSIREQR